jgi:peptidoglycan/LPS O-acetylase OafA/YrhL
MSNIHSSVASDNRIPELDVLRGFAAIGVMIYHYSVVFSSMVNHTDYRIYVPYGVYAVHLFFIISGFVISMTLQHTKRPMDFVVSRFSRLYPVFWIAVLLTQSVVWLSPNTEFSVSWRVALVNLTMVAEVFHFPLVDNVYWSLVIELIFYTIIFFIWRCGLLSKIEFLVIPWCLFQILAAYSYSIFGYQCPQVITVALLLKYAHLFMAGILFYRLRTIGDNTSTLTLIVACLCTEFLVQGSSAGVFCTGFFIIFYFLVKNKLNIIAVKPLIFIGSISYSLYLIHQNIGFEIMLRMKDYPRIVQLLVASLVVILLSWGLRVVVEIPSMRWIRSVYKRVYPI